MPAYSRAFILFFFSTLTAHLSGQTALPAMVETVTFSVKTADENDKLVVSLLPQALRIDLPDSGYSVIYDENTQHYLGLEHRNYTYWQFSWPEVEKSVEASSRYELRLNDLTSDGLASYMLSSGTNTVMAPLVPDQPTYLWKTTDQKKLVAGLTASQWIGTNSIGDQVEAWCVPAPLPTVQTALARVRTMNEPVALVPVRNLIPPLIYPIADTLSHGGVVPVEISWGTGDTRTNHFSLIQIKTVPVKKNLLAVPPEYMETTLVTMDGILNTNSPPSGNPAPDSPPTQAPMAPSRDQNQ